MKTTHKTKKEILELLELVRASCEEGMDETWDCSTEEGRQSFQPMIDDLEEVISYVNNQKD